MMTLLLLVIADISWCSPHHLRLRMLRVVVRMLMLMRIVLVMVR
jgi:hypothetical protein